VFQIKLSRNNPFILFFPFLLLFILFVANNFSNPLTEDELKYLQFAKNLIDGFYSPPAPKIDLWWGPGYPIVLMPFVGFNLPTFSILVLNAVFQYLSVVFLFKSIIKFANFKLAIGISLFWGLCYSAYDFMAFIYSESLTTFLITLLVYLTLVAFNSNSKKLVLLSGIVLGYIILTKIIFAYVVTFLLLGCLVFIMIVRNNQNIKNSLITLTVALLITTPYLFYTYNLTGRIFYWGNSGGMSLYWMSTPYENEYGDWNREDFEKQGKYDTIISELLKNNHQKNIREITKYEGVEKDDAYKRIAIKNIKEHPVKFIKNIIANFSRLMFGFPLTYNFQRPLLKVFYFSIFFTFCFFSAVMTLINWKKIQYPILLLLLIGVIYMGGSLFLSMYNRMMIVVMPIFFVWIAEILNKTLRLKIVISA